MQVTESGADLGNYTLKSKKNVLRDFASRSKM